MVRSNDEQIERNKMKAEGDGTIGPHCTLVYVGL